MVTCQTGNQFQGTPPKSDVQIRGVLKRIYAVSEPPMTGPYSQGLPKPEEKRVRSAAADPSSHAATEVGRHSVRLVSDDSDLSDLVEWALCQFAAWAFLLGHMPVAALGLVLLSPLALIYGPRLRAKILRMVKANTGRFLPLDQ